MHIFIYLIIPNLIIQFFLEKVKETKYSDFIELNWLDFYFCAKEFFITAFYLGIIAKRANFYDLDM